MRRTRAALYYRVSTREQSHALQLDELRAEAARRDLDMIEYVDVASGVVTKRPERDRLMADVAAGRIDLVLVWRFDRFARSTKDLLETLDRFRAAGVEFASIKEGIDTATTVGRFMFTVVGAVAEFERELIRERVKAGLDAARRRGRRIGRPRRYVDVATVERRLAAGDSFRGVAREMGIDARTMRHALARARRNPSPEAASEAGGIAGPEHAHIEQGKT